jgi:polar amino acid transport system ATP-binding protein
MLATKTEQIVEEKLIGVENPLVAYKKVSKSFGDLKVIREVDFSVSPGEKVAIIGPSGSGKTTLIRLLMTLEEPTSGVIEINGEPLWHKEVNGKLMKADEKHLHKMRGQIGMVFQQFNLFPHMTVLRNCTEAPVEVLGISRKDAEKRAIAMLEKVGLGNKLRSYPAQLSGGQQQRVAIARALVMRPKVMLFDEPTSALDPELVGEVLDVIREIASEGEMAMILVTHEMDFAKDVADRIVFTDGGKIVEQGPPKEVFENPKSERLQAFLSRMRS